MLGEATSVDGGRDSGRLAGSRSMSEVVVLVVLVVLVVVWFGFWGDKASQGDKKKLRALVWFS